MAIDVSQLRKLDARSVQVNPPPDGSLSNYFVVNVAGAADGMIPWGTSPANRDRQLREFYVTEPWLASTVASLSARNAAFSWTLEGPPRTCDRIQTMLHASNYGAGWVDLLMKLSTDLYTSDNGAFLEIIRDGDSPSAAAIGLATLDSSRCQRTGNWETPVIYTDREGQRHKLQWFQVLDFTDAPSTLETMNGLGFCAAGRVLRYAQIMRDTAVYQHEKVSGRNPGALHIVSGVSTQAITDILKQAAENNDNRLRTRYEVPAVMGTLDPAAEVRMVSILLKSLPENYDAEADRKWYIAALALAFGAEYQDLAPLPGGGLGTSAQSQTLHLKAKGKGPELFQKMLTHKLNFYVLPQNVQFKFDEKDYEALSVEAGVRKVRAETRAARITSGEITPQVARQIANDEGDLKNEYMQLMAAEDVTPEGQVTDEEIEPEPAVVQAQETPTPVVPPVAGAAPGQVPTTGQKFNPYHDAGGRFSSGQGADFATIRPGSGIERYSQVQRQRMATEAATRGPKLLNGADYDVSGTPMPDLSGTPKQVSWGSQVRAGTVQDMNRGFIDSASAANTFLDTDPEHITRIGDRLTRQKHEYERVVSEHTTASWWIDNRNVYMWDHTKKLALGKPGLTSKAIDDESPDENLSGAAKEFDAGEWERRRVRREKEYEDELTAILAEVQARVVASVKRELAT